MARGNFGERLKRERELREVTQQEITSATRIGSRFLEALENEDWDKLPGGVFNRGFVRSIARYLGLDEEAFLAEYDLAYGSQVAPPVERPEDRIPSPPRWLPVAFVLGVIVLIGAVVAAGIYGWRYYRARHSQVTPVAPSSALLRQAAEAQPATSATVTLPPLDLAVSPSVSTHLRVLSDGNLVFDKEIRPGENLHFSASTDFEVTAADSAAVLLELNGQTVPPIGLPGSSGTIKLTRDDLR